MLAWRSMLADTMSSIAIRSSSTAAVTLTPPKFNRTWSPKITFFSGGILIFHDQNLDLNIKPHGSAPWEVAVEELL